MKVELALPEKPEVFRMAGALNLHADTVTGKLVRVWAWFDRHTPDGNAVGVTFADVDTIAGVSGFAGAMNEVRWLNRTYDGVQVPRFDRHNGDSAKKRAVTGRRVANHRSEKREQRDVSNDDDVTKSVAREEKRREEQSTLSQREIAVPLQMDWQPDQECWDAIAMRPDVKYPSASVISEFVGEYAGTLIAPYRLPGKFVKWCSRERVFAAVSGGRKFKNDGGASVAIAAFEKSRGSE